MNMHDKMAKELFDNKSLKALSYLIEHGRELEFEYDKKICFLSKDNSSGFVSIWVEKKEQYSRHQSAYVMPLWRHSLISRICSAIKTRVLRVLAKTYLP